MKGRIYNFQYQLGQFVFLARSAPLTPLEGNNNGCKTNINPHSEKVLVEVYSGYFSFPNVSLYHNCF